MPQHPTDQQTIIWANVDLDPCRHMMSLGHNELTHQYITRGLFY